ncbi:uncharacterized protein family [Actinidia rufa]|uniref:Uncharacterized protein family n=1 Tax=Actinidia rufa TaxID=165716 RepID=A0A7J0DDE9_9ERIC|nr:uncharacterized protein family [Actinidia rufa]
MGGELRYEIGHNTYIKLVLHALKHKTSAVNGVLLGRLSGADATPVVELAESVPLFHSHHIGLLPPLEIALIQLDNKKLEALPKGKDRGPVVQVKSAISFGS